ncbi:MAG: GIY-YIG nuclease family protein [Alistipes sp.]|jgi:putative endonuclease|nr:GIY-YIG nuclease family protein [Alistipes sp.]
MKEYFVYILTNVNKTVLYTGVTNNLERRLAEHRDESSEASVFTGRYGVKYLLHYERFQRILDAIAREKEIKGWRREKKIKLIESENPHWKFLNEEDI